MADDPAALESSWRDGGCLELETEPLTRLALALYCGASGDHHPLHVDIDWVRDKTELPDVIGHGMLTMAYAGRLLTAHFRPEQIKSLTMRFLAPSEVGDVMICTARPADASKVWPGAMELALTVATTGGRQLAAGAAVIDGAEGRGR